MMTTVFTFVIVVSLVIGGMFLERFRQYLVSKKDKAFSVKSALLWAVDPAEWDKNVSDEKWDGMAYVATRVQNVMLTHWDDPELEKEFGYDKRFFMGRKISAEDSEGVDFTERD